jgi:hypothetical protein
MGTIIAGILYGNNQALKVNKTYRTGECLRWGDPKGGTMARKRKPQYTVPEKTCWHLYSLQNLHPEKFVKVVGKILKKEHLLIK